MYILSFLNNLFSLHKHAELKLKFEQISGRGGGSLLDQAENLMTVGFFYIYLEI